MAFTNEQELISYFPDSLYEIKKYLRTHSLEDILEIRLRLAKPIEIKKISGDVFISQIVTNEEMIRIVENLCNHSIYAMQNCINQGFLTIKGGHRVGLSGTSVLCQEEMKNMKEISSLNIRVAHELKGCSNDLLKIIYHHNHFENTLLLSPPGCGKTTILRDMIRNISDGFEENQGRTIALVDERGEIAASYKGVPQNEIGIRTDVMSYIPKWLGMKMMIRSMSPDILATDEIGEARDYLAILDAVHSGVKLLLTMHGEDIEDISQELLQKKIFKNIIVLTKRSKPGDVKKVYQWEESQYVLSC